MLNPPKPLLSVEEHKELLLKSRRNDAIADEVCRLLKCKPTEMLERINRLQEDIAKLEAQIASYNQPKEEPK